MASRVSGRRPDNVRIGPISIITLIAVICMAVLAVLTASTANATMTISQRQSDGAKEMYLNESAAQEFVAGIDDVLAPVRAGKPKAGDAMALVSSSLDAVCEAARAAADGKVAVTANIEGNIVKAEFVGQKMRRLSIAISIQDNATYRVEKWKAAAAQQEAQTMGNLWTGA